MREAHFHIKTRKLGKSGLEVSAIGLGCMWMSFAYGLTSDKNEMKQAEKIWRIVRDADFSAFMKLLCLITYQPTTRAVIGKLDFILKISKFYFDSSIFLRFHGNISLFEAKVRRYRNIAVFLGDFS